MEYKSLPKSQKTFSNTIDTITKFGFMWNYVPSSLRTKDTLGILLRHHGWMIQYVKEYIDYELAMTAISNYPFAIRHVPVWLINEHLVNLAFEKDPNVIPYIPKRYITAEMCCTAVKHSCALYQYTPLSQNSSVEKVYQEQLEKLEIARLEKIARVKGNYRKRLLLKK